MKPLGRFPALGLLLLAASSADGQSFLDWNGLKQGPHAVGFRVVATTDATRTCQTPTDYRGRPRPSFGNRPVQVSIWYPAEVAPVSTAMTYGDYVDLLAWETGPSKSGLEARKTSREQFQRMSGLPLNTAGLSAFERLRNREISSSWRVSSRRCRKRIRTAWPPSTSASVVPPPLSSLSGVRA